MSGIGMSEGFRDQIVEVIREFQNRLAQTGAFVPQQGADTRFNLVVLDEDLASASSTLASVNDLPSAVASHVNLVELLATSVRAHSSTDKITLYNFSELASYSAGDYGYYIDISGVNVFIPFVAGEGGGGDIMHYDIDEVDCDGTGYWRVTPTHYTGGCSNPPGDDPYTGFYYVRPYGFASTFTQEELETSGKGVAAYTFNLETCEKYWLEVNHYADQGC